MDFLRTLLARLAALSHCRQLDADLDDELRAHLDLAIAENLKCGMAADAAETEAFRAFGGITQTREAYRIQRGMPLLVQFARDLRYAFRQLRRSPGFAFTAILTLALGIGAITSIFSIVDTVLLKPFAFHDPNRLAVLRETEDEIRNKTPSVPFNYRHYLRLKQDSMSLDDAAIFQQPALSVSPNGDRPEIVGAVSASPNFLHVLGVAPTLGRDFAPADAVNGANRVVILTDEGWQELFQRNPHVIGQTLRITDPYTVIGVLPPGLRFPHIAAAPNLAAGPHRQVMLFEPLVPSENDLHRDTGNFNFNVIARLKPAVTPAQATAELDTLQHSYSASAHLPFHLGIALSPLAKDVTSGISTALWLLFAAVGAVLLIACVNLANLQLARAVASEREIAVRAALGATRRRLMMTRFAESLLLAVLGGISGAALALFGTRLLLSLVPSNVPRLDEVAINLPVLLFAAGISISAALFFGTLPALRSLRVEPQTALQANSARAASPREGRRIRDILVMLQVACTVVLLIITALVLHSFKRLLTQNRGFDASHITFAQVDLYASQYSDKLPNVQAVKLAFVDRAIASVNQIPGVQSVALTSAAPLTGETWIDLLVRPDHPVPENQRPMINVRWIDPDFLPSMHMSLVAGRNFTTSDRANPNVALLSERAAREGFPGENPIGRKIADMIPNYDHDVTVVGVVADTRINGLKDDAAMAYLPYYAFTPWTLTFLVGSAQQADTLMPEIRRALWQIDPQIAIPVLKSMDDQLIDSVAVERLQAIVLTSFGAAALFLALLGVYGVLAYSVTMRRRELGIRIALGSCKAALMRLVLYQAAIPILLGAAIGLAFAFIGVRLIGSLLYETPAFDPLAIGGSVLLVIVATTLAATLPARRAAAIDPMRALRSE